MEAGETHLDMLAKPNQGGEGSEKGGESERDRERRREGERERKGGREGGRERGREEAERGDREGRERKKWFLELGGSRDNELTATPGAYL